MEIDGAGWLKKNAEGYPEIFRVPSSRTQSLDTAAPLGIVWHWTAGPCRGEGYARALAESIRAYNRGTDRPASWHILVAKDGRVFQSVPFLLGSWHVGRPGRIGDAPLRKQGGGWETPTGRLFANINRSTIGVELENSGTLEKVGDKFYCWPFWLDPDAPDADKQPDPKMEVDANRAVLLDGIWFDSFPDAQVQAATRLLQTLVLTYKLDQSVCGYGHVMFDYPRKIDPGELWLQVALPQVMTSVFGAP